MMYMDGYFSEDVRFSINTGVMLGRQRKIFMCHFDVAVTGMASVYHTLLLILFSLGQNVDRLKRSVPCCF